MSAIIAFIIALGIISSPEQATPELIDQYEQQYYESVISKTSKLRQASYFTPFTSGERPTRAASSNFEQT